MSHDQFNQLVSPNGKKAPSSSVFVTDDKIDTA